MTGTTPLAPVVDAVRDVWEGYFGSPIAPGGTNWNAYTHQQLHDMLWDSADVGDVSAMAAEWGRHGSELADHATTLREQRGALQAHWTGEAASTAGDRLGALGNRTEDIGTRAGTMQQATQHAGDALAVARNTMPAPPGDPTALVLAGAVAGGGAGAAIGAVAGAGAAGVGAGPGALIGAAIGAVAGGAGSLFLASLAAAERKAEAVHVMQTYEASLAASGQTLTPAAANTAADNAIGLTTTPSDFSGGGLGGGTGTGVPWQQLTGGAPGVPASAAGSPVSGLPIDPLTGLPAEPTTPAGTAEEWESAAGRGAGNGMVPGGPRRTRGGEDGEHVNRMPASSQPVFDADLPGSVPVIGL